MSYGVAKVIEAIDWEALKNLVRRITRGISAAVQKAAHLFVAVFTKKIAAGFLEALFGATGMTFYRLATVWNKAQRIVYNEEKEQFNSLTDIRDSSIRQAVNTTGQWAIETALEG